MSKAKITKLIQFEDSEYIREFFHALEMEDVSFAKWARRHLTNAIVGFMADHGSSQIGTGSATPVENTDKKEV